LTEDLSEWRIKNKKLRDNAEEMEEIYNDFDILRDSFLDGFPNRYQANSLRGKIDHCTKRLEGIKLTTNFDKLVQREFVDSLWTHRSWLELFFTKKGATLYGVRLLLNNMFVPQKLWDGDDDVFHYIKTQVNRIWYKDHSKLAYLMKPISNYSLADYDCEEKEEKIKEEFAKIKTILVDFNYRKGFITEEQRKGLQDIDIQYNLMQKKFSDISENFSEDILALHFDMKLLTDPTATANWDFELNFLGVAKDSFHMYMDPETKEVKVYLGEVLNHISHENSHGLQHYFSRYMPAGIRLLDGAFNFHSGAIEEGLARRFEDIFVKYVSESRDEIGFNKDDVERLRLFSKTHFHPVIVRLYHSLLHREKDFEVDSVSPKKEESEKGFRELGF
jgi:hypothetical protein